MMFKAILLGQWHSGVVSFWQTVFHWVGSTSTCERGLQFIVIWFCSFNLFSKLLDDKYPSPECLRVGLYHDSIQVNMVSLASVLFFQEYLSINSHSREAKNFQPSHCHRHRPHCPSRDAHPFPCIACQTQHWYIDIVINDVIICIQCLWANPELTGLPGFQ